MRGLSVEQVVWLKDLEVPLDSTRPQCETAPEPQARPGVGHLPARPVMTDNQRLAALEGKAVGPVDQDTFTGDDASDDASNENDRSGGGQALVPAPMSAQAQDRSPARGHRRAPAPGVGTRPAQWGRHPEHAEGSQDDEPCPS